jgi:Fe-S-cluster containining protein
LRDAESQHLGARMLQWAQAMAATEHIGEFAATGWLPDSFFDALAELYAAYDAYIEHNIAASDLKILCKVGCARCCHQHAYSTYAFEIVNLYRQLRPRADYFQRFSALLASSREFETMFANYKQKADGRDDLAVVNALQHLAALGKPCALLSGNKCSVYADRPVTCRMYHSLTSPVLCTTVIGRTFHLVPPDDVVTVLAGINGRMLLEYCEFLAQGLVVFAARREHRPWGPPPGR